MRFKTKSETFWPFNGRPEWEQTNEMDGKKGCAQCKYVLTVEIITSFFIAFYGLSRLFSIFEYAHFISLFPRPCMRVSLTRSIDKRNVLLVNGVWRARVCANLRLTHNDNRLCCCCDVLNKNSKLLNIYVDLMTFCLGHGRLNKTFARRF